MAFMTQNQESHGDMTIYSLRPEVKGINTQLLNILLILFTATEKIKIKTIEISFNWRHIVLLQFPIVIHESIPFRSIHRVGQPLISNVLSIYQNIWP